MLDIEQLLQPIAGSNQCGIDLDYDSRFQEVKDIVESGSEEEPAEWKKVRKQCLELLNDGRSIELLVLLAASSIAAEGYQGLRDGLVTLSKSVQEFWDSIYPELDMEDPEDERYDMRLNSIAQLGEQPRKMGDKLGYVEMLLRAPLIAGGGRSSHAYWPIWISDAGDDVDSAEVGAVHDAINRMAPEEKTALLVLVEESIAAVSSLSDFLMEKTGASYNAPFDEYLMPVLQKIQSFLKSGSEAADLPASVDEDTDLAIEPGVEAGALPTPMAKPTGAINSSGDVKRALDKIIAYYREAEPSSPVPFLLERANKLIDADFISIVKNLNQDSEYQFRTTLDITDSD